MPCRGPVAALAVLVLYPLRAGIVWDSGRVNQSPIFCISFRLASIMEPALQQVTPNVEEVAAPWMRRTKAFGESRCRSSAMGLYGMGVDVSSNHEGTAGPHCCCGLVGFDTLAIRVAEASEEYYQLAAPAALLIVILSLPALMLLVSKDWRGRRRRITSPRGTNP